MRNNRTAFTLTEVLLAVAIVGIIAALVLPMVSTHYQNELYNHAYKREIDTIESAVDGLSVNENKANFFDTMMYTSSEPEDYKESSEKFLRKYVKTTKICSEAKDCFAQEYYEYTKDEQNRNVKKEYKPEYKGSCGILKNGMSMCITPQIGGEGIHGIIDLNGKKGPNVHNRDLREFSLSSRTRVGLDTTTDVVRSLDWENMGGEENPCEGMVCGCGDLPECPHFCTAFPDTWDLSCCQSNISKIDSYKHHCCTFDAIKSSNSKCNRIGINISCLNVPINGSTSYKAQCTIKLFDGNQRYNTVKFSELPKDYRVKVNAGIFEMYPGNEGAALISCQKVNELWDKYNPAPDPYLYDPMDNESQIPGGETSIDKIKPVENPNIQEGIFNGRISQPYKNKNETYEFNIQRSYPGSERTEVLFTSPTKRMCYPSSGKSSITITDLWTQQSIIHNSGFSVSVWTDAVESPTLNNKIDINDEIHNKL